MRQLYLYSFVDIYVSQLCIRPRLIKICLFHFLRNITYLICTFYIGIIVKYLRISTKLLQTSVDDDFDNDACLSSFGKLANYWNERNERSPVPLHSPPFSPSYPLTQTHCVMEVAAPDVLDLGGHGRQTLGPALYVSCVHAMTENK